MKKTFALFLCSLGLLVGYALPGAAQPAADSAEAGLAKSGMDTIGAWVEKLSKPGTTLKEMIALLGEPARYVWQNEQTGRLQTFDKEHLPECYIAEYSQDLAVVVQGGQLAEFRCHRPGRGFAYRKLRLGSSLEEALAVLGPPVKTVVGEPLSFEAGVLYKDIDAKPGFCYYGRPEQKVRLAFQDYKVTALFVTLIDESTHALPGPARPASPRGFVGLEVRIEGVGPVITKVIEDSPAQRAGLVAGERILKINRDGTEKKSLAECVKLIIGVPGEKVTLTVAQPGDGPAQPREVTLVRQERKPQVRLPVRDLQSVKRQWTLPPTKEAGPVEWKGNRIVSRVLPYPDFVSFFIRLPMAHAVATGQGVKVAILQAVEDKVAATLIQNIAPQAEVILLSVRTNEAGLSLLRGQLAQSGCRIALVPDVSPWPGALLVELAQQLASAKTLLVIPSDRSEEPRAVELVNQLQALGALTVGRVNQQSTVQAGRGDQDAGNEPFNRHIRQIQTDVFSATGIGSDQPLEPAATAAGVAALALERWPELSPTEVRQKMILRGS